MNNEGFNMKSYDDLFSEKTLVDGLEVYLLYKIYDLKNIKNRFSCKMKETDIYEVSVVFKDNDDIDKMVCTCPFAKKGNNCKHMYAFLLKLKGNYNLEIIRKEVVNGIDELTQIFNDFEKDLKLLKKKHPKYNKDIECVTNQINCYRLTYSKIVEKSKKNINKILLLKDIIMLKKDLYSRIKNFNEYIELNMSINSKNREFYHSSNRVEKSPSLFKLFLNLLFSVNKEQEKRDEEYEEEKQRYRRAIIEQNLYEGKTNEDIYDGLDN